jgi:hypothetical protein
MLNRQDVSSYLPRMGGISEGVYTILLHDRTLSRERAESLTDTLIQSPVVSHIGESYELAGDVRLTSLADTG